ncbi:hypothetical protein [Mesorhizobium sp. NZP2298]|uniref:hypothetical protein n=1 Tax=Mesorhizobium sp. NZP2298 TaxID=2483403 RepID=UPI00155480EB|nr:hypothetical protein [Mesorhizobium sp. NZP2298]QKC96940.1 hypothetical protein EB231_21345 [Mesorhizobium sp. NZP2298]
MPSARQVKILSIEIETIAIFPQPLNRFLQARAQCRLRGPAQLCRGVSGVGLIAMRLHEAAE